ncbi:TRAF3-interacting JNK-activating modulator [Silurus meridionalis]|nr:TRAF3-interacting JNK-activating modulator [Silurus meridionalis]
MSTPYRHSNISPIKQSRCDEDLLKNKIKTLEAQLQLSMKGVPQDGLKKVVLMMENQKEEYEKKALEAIQKATEENSEAQAKLQNLQEALQVAQAESVRWQKLFEDLRENYILMRKNQDQCNDQLQQIQNQLQRSREQEESLRHQCNILQQDKAEFHSDNLLLEQDNQILREQLEKFIDSHESWNNITEDHKQGLQSYQFAETDTSVIKQLHQTEQKLSLKDKECVELKAELEILEQECYSYQIRLAQCREELNTLSARNSRSTRKIISRCDLSLIQEVRDSKGKAVPAMLKNLNRKDVLMVQEQVYYHELKQTEFNDTETFSREPFIIKIHSPTTVVKNFIIIGHHSCPRKAMHELEELFEVFQAVRKKWKTENVMLLGDLNADCGYVTNKGRKKLRLRNDPKFLWLITDEQDTTVRDKTHCAYDRSTANSTNILLTYIMTLTDLEKLLKKVFHFFLSYSFIYNLIIFSHYRSQSQCRNHKVTFCLDNESSEYDEEDSDRYGPFPPTSLPYQCTQFVDLYQSESDDPLEKPYYPERSRKQPKEQQPVCAAVKQHPPKNRVKVSAVVICLTLNKE